MKYAASLFGLILFIAMFFQCGTTPPATTADNPPEVNWKKIDSLIDHGMSRSALEEVEQIVRAFQSISDANPDKIKAAVYQSRLEAKTMDDFHLKYIDLLKQKHRQWSQPGASILSYYLAEAYEQYLLINRWNIQQRSEGNTGPGDQPEFWSPDQFTQKIASLYLRSVDWPGLKNSPIDSFQPLLQPIESRAMKNLSLYEVLGHRAIDYFSSPARYVTKPTYSFIIDNPVVFANRETFTTWNISTRDTTSFDYRALKLFQNQLEEYGNSQHYAAVLTDLDRLSFAHRQAEIDGKDSLYLEALDLLAEGARTDSIYATVLYRKASFLENNPEKNEALQRALDLCERAISAYPGSSGAKQCKNLKAQLLKKELTVQFPEAPYPGQDILSLASWKNLKAFRWNIHTVSEEEWKELHSSGDRHQTFKNFEREAIEQGTIELPATDDLKSHEVEWKLPALNQGFYVLTAKPGAKNRSEHLQLFQVTPWAVTMMNDAKEQLLRITDRKTGQPLENLTVELHRYERTGRSRSELRKFAEFQTDARGVVDLENIQNKNFRVTVRKGDRAYISDGMLNTYRRGGGGNVARRSYFFTDRAIYRPGQTVHFKTLLTEEQEGKYPEILPDKAFKITLRDANHQELKTKELKTNAYGSASGSFVLPEGGLTGRFTMESSIGHQRKFIRVEEYKRPSFEVEFEEVSSAYRLGDTLTLAGTASNYAGNPVDGGAVRWKVVRRQFIYRPYDYGIIPPPGGSEERILAVGTGRTNPDGSFEVECPLVAGTGSNSNRREVYSYQVEAIVTDRQGETQSTQRTLRAGRQPFHFQIRHDALYAFRAPDTLTVKSLNWDDQGVPKTARIKLQLLDRPDRILRDRLWPAPDQYLMDRQTFIDRFPHDPYKDEHNRQEWPVQKTVQSTTITTSQNGVCSWILPDELPPGTYRMSITHEETGVQIERHFEWIPASSKVKTTALLAADLKSREVLPGQTASLALSTAMEELPVVLRIKRMNQPVEILHRTIGENEVLTFPIEDRDRGGFSINVTANALNRNLSKNLSISIPWTNKDLDIHWSRIRDDLRPGEQTEWTLQINAPDESPADAEFLTTLYDASLDAIEKNSWTTPAKPSLRFHTNTSFLDFGTHQYRPVRYRPDFSRAPLPSWPKFEQFEQNYRYYGRQADGVTVRESKQPASEKTQFDEQQEKSDTEPTEEQEPDQNIPPLRENFDETVFFFPQLKPDTSGNIQLNFTMNDALTRWRLMGIAHSKDLKMGRTEQEVVTNQEFMTFPNLPRFLREGDRIRLTTKVVNQSNEAIEGNGRLVLTNLVTGKTLNRDWIQSELQPAFNIEAGRSGAVSWTLEVPGDFKGVLQVEALATAGELTDGERHILPVVSEEMLVTETLPLPLGAEEKERFTFEQMEGIPEGSNPHRYTLEFTPNPAWYAVKALPWLAEPKSKNSESIFNQLFANELAAHIAESNPSIRDVFQLWQQDEEALESELLKNQELKQNLLEETPWVMDALRETDRRKQIAALFDPNQLQYAREDALRKLKEYQIGSGAFPWFKGGGNNFYISLHLLEGFGRLRNIGLLEENSSARSIIEELIPYCDEAAVQWFEKHHEEGTGHLPDYILLQYLKARSDFIGEYPLPEETKALRSAIFTQISKHWQDLNLYGQGLSVLIAHRFELGDLAETILTSIEERALLDEETGMYWRSETGRFWYQRPIERHVLLMQCFHELRKAGKSYEQLRIWLLKQKQTQHWETSKSTAAAIYALLMRGEDWLSDQKSVVIQLGGQNIEVDPSETEAGTGYFKKSWEDGEIEKEFSDITVDNPNDHIAWGAAYYQYFAPMSAVSSSGSEGWSITKSYYQLKITDEGERRVPLSDGDPLNVGDKVLVRLEVRTDRTANYVHIKDRRVSGMEPVQQKSSYSWQGGVGYYKNPRDLTTNFFMDYMPKGNYVFEYELYAAQSGSFSAGTASIQCYYAPEFAAHSAGARLSIEE